MLRNVSAFVLLGLGLGSNAQSWCPPGATWTYDHAGFVGLQGYSVMTYTHDTVLDGQVGQLIDLYTVGLNFDQQVDTLVWPSPGYITRSSGDQVYVWSDFAQSWDTLYNFDVVPGDEWLPPHAQPSLCGGPEFGDAVQVLDTGTVVIDGLSLRWVDVQCGFYDGRVTERLGWSLGLVIFEGCWVPECDCGLRCYQDSAINYVRPGLATPCEHLDQATSVKEPGGAVPVRIVPNPGTTHFTLEFPPGPHTINLFDATGRRVLQQRTTDARAVIDTQALPAGLYRITVRDAQGGSFGSSWVKE